MGYYINITNSHFVIKSENFDAAYKAVCELNNHNELKGGGRYPSENIDGPHPGIWFSWMDWNYPETCPDLKSVLTQVGFEVHLENGDISYLHFDKKMGDEAHFMNALAPYVESGSYIEWVGEDHNLWRWEFNDGKMFEKVGKVVYE